MSQFPMGMSVEQFEALKKKGMSKPRPPSSPPIFQSPRDGMIRTMDFIDRNNNGIDDRDEKPPRGDPKLQPIKQAPIRTTVMPPPSDYGSDDLFGAPGAGTYNNLMSQAFQEYSSGQSPYAGAADFLMNRPVFDRGARPDSSMPSTEVTPTFGYGESAGIAQLQAQQPAMQAQYDQFAQQIQSAQEAAQQAAQQAAARQQEQTDLATSERQALMDRIAALEGREQPDLDAFGQQLRQDILGEVDIDALRREITGEVLQIAQAEFPDVMQIRDEVMSLLPEQEQIDVENLRRQIQESIDAGAPPEEIAALRQELQNRIRPVEEQLAGLQDERSDIAQQIGELRGEVGSLPEVDVEAIRQQIIQSLPEQDRIDIEDLQRRIQASIDAGAPEEEIAGLRLELEQRLAPVEERVSTIRDQVADFRQNFDPATLREQIGNLRGRLEGLPNFDAGAMQEAARRALEERGGFIPPELAERLRAVEQREAPDEAAIAERVRSGLDPRIADLRERLGRVDTSNQTLAERIAALREQRGEAARERRSLEERLGSRLDEIRGSVSPLSERIAQLRGRLDERPQIDENALIERIRGGIKAPQVDLSGIREQIANLRGRLDAGVPPGTGGIKPMRPDPKLQPIKQPAMALPPARGRTGRRGGGG